MLVGILLVIGSFALITFWSGPWARSPNLCKEAPIRREWRSLTFRERTEFIQGVNCLSTKPSSWGLNGTLYDDYALLHGRIGSWCWWILLRRFFCWIIIIGHRSASFFPWHRYTLHIWETALRDQCGFRGQLPFVWHPAIAQAIIPTDIR